MKSHAQSHGIPGDGPGLLLMLGDLVAEGEPEWLAEWLRVSVGELEGDGEADGDTDTDEGGGSEAEGDSECETELDDDGDTDPEGDREGDCEPECETDGDTDGTVHCTVHPTQFVRPSPPPVKKSKISSSSCVASEGSIPAAYVVIWLIVCPLNVPAPVQMARPNVVAGRALSTSPFHAPFNSAVRSFRWN
jgi:hypothetical protein